MLLIFTLVVINNNRVVEMIKPSWKRHFPEVAFELITTTGATPYKEFFNYYHEVLASNPNAEKIKEHLDIKFKLMQEENKDLLEAMSRDSERNK